MSAAQHTPGAVYPAGTRYSNSEWYDVATTEFVHGWQVFEQMTPDGKPTGRKSFLNNEGVLCGIEIAKVMRDRAIQEAAPDLLDAAVKALAECADLIGTSAGDALQAAIAKATGGQP